MDATNSSSTWVEQNQQYLAAQLARVRQLLAQAAGKAPATDEALASPAAFADAMSPAQPALTRLCETFALSPFERDLLLLCAGIELDSAFAPLCASAQGDPRQRYTTFALALAILPGAHWSALSPAAPLRQLRLIEVGEGTALTSSPLKINEHILHYLAGTPYLDEQVAVWAERVVPVGEPVPSQRALVERILRLWSAPTETDLPPVIQLVGADGAGKRALAQTACAAQGLTLYALDARILPTDIHELETWQRAWEREAALNAYALLVDAPEPDDLDAARARALTHWLERTRGPLLLAAPNRVALDARQTLALEVTKPTVREQQRVWHDALGAHAAHLDGALDALAGQFDLDAATIRAAAAETLASAPQDLAGALWEASRSRARPRLDDLAQRIEPRASWSDIVLPALQRNILRELAAQVRQRHRVYDTWGWGKTQARGLGISALFAGASGTGKTMAGEVLANELRLDLYRIDLSAVVSKYIGETEKNLRRVFDAAEQGGAILFFDEADALFGKRSEVKDSHDRYANIEVSYLLQRMEAYRGLAILTTNMQEALDKAFLRRLRFIVPFPFPDATQRAEIWQRIFPAATPLGDLDYARLARLNITGGSIRNIALNATFLAADANAPVEMSHLLRAAQSEYAKLDKTLTDMEVRDWAR